jgi:hypothetical protein
VNCAHALRARRLSDIAPTRRERAVMTCGYYRTSSPVTAFPIIRRWISDMPSKMVKLVDVRAVSAGRCRNAGAEPAPIQHRTRPASARLLGASSRAVGE